jgi:hypothetical protein
MQLFTYDFAKQVKLDKLHMNNGQINVSRHTVTNTLTHNNGDNLIGYDASSELGVIQFQWMIFVTHSRKLYAIY